MRETVTHVPRESHIWFILGPGRVRLNLARLRRMTHRLAIWVGGSTSLRESWTSQGMRRERLSYFVLRRHLGTGTLAGSTISDNFKVGCIAGDSDRGPFPFMHACMHHGTWPVNAPTKTGTQPTSEWKSHGERKRKRVRFDDKRSSPLRHRKMTG